MSITPFLLASPVIQIHTLAALIALILGPVALYGAKGQGALGRLHRAAGYSWVVVMAVTALSSFWIGHFGWVGPFSPIHILSVITLMTLWTSVQHARNGRIKAHSHAMRSLYWYGLVMAGLFNFLPGRLVNRTLFADAADLGIWVIAAGLFGLLLRGRFKGRSQRITDVKRFAPHEARQGFCRESHFSSSHPAQASITSALPSQERAVVAELVDAQR